MVLAEAEEVETDLFGQCTASRTSADGLGSRTKVPVGVRGVLPSVADQPGGARDEGNWHPHADVDHFKRSVMPPAMPPSGSSGRC